MNTNQGYQVNQSYTGQRNVLVPTRMYSRNTLLNAMHIKSDKYLGVNLSKYALTFHSDKTSIDADPEHEISFSKIRSLEADVTKESAGKYYLKVHTDEGDLKFKFGNATDFHNVVEALRNTLHNDKPFYDATDSYKNSINPKQSAGQLIKSNYSVSSDDEHGYNDLDAHKRMTANQEFKADKSLAKDEFEIKKQEHIDHFNSIDDQRKKEKKTFDSDFSKQKEAVDDIKKDNLDLTHAQYKSNKALIDNNKYRSDLDKQANNDTFKSNKVIINNDYDVRRENSKSEYKANKGIDKEMANEEYKLEKHAAKAMRESDLSYNKDIYKANKEAIKDNKHVDNQLNEIHHEKNEVAKEFAKAGIKQDAKEATQDLKAGQKAYKHDNELEKDIAKNDMKAHIQNDKINMKDDIKEAREIKDSRY